MPFQLTGYKVFIASPGGLETERNAFKECIDEYNVDQALPEKIMFEPVGWENVLAGVGRPQSLINKELRKCDYCIVVLADRWGSDPGENEVGATSGTEEEFRLAMKCFRDNDKPMSQVVVFFKAVPENQMSDPGVQLSKVLEFRKKIEREKTLMYETFSSIREFERLIKRYLGHWRRNSSDMEMEVLQSPVNPINELPTNPLEREIETSNNTEKAWLLAEKGLLVDAEVEFSKIVVNSPKTLDLLSYSKFLIRQGKFDHALVMLDKVIAISKEEGDEMFLSRAHMHKGNVLLTRGDLDGANEMYESSFEIAKKLNFKQGMANQLGNMGNLLKIRGDSNGAESMFKQSLKIAESIPYWEGLADQYGNLGTILQLRGDLDGAEEMFEKALKIEKDQNRQEGVAIQYGNLGVLYKKRGNLDAAEKMFRKSLKIQKKLGRLIGVASQYGNLGIIYKDRNKLKKAEEMLNKALELNKQIGRLEGMAADYGNLGNVLRYRKDLEGAEESYKRALAINKELKRLPGMAIQYGNLGLVLMQRDDLSGAEAMFEKSLAIEEKLGRLEGMANQYGNLGSVYRKRKEFASAEDLYHKCLDIAKSAGYTLIVDRVEEYLSRLKEEKE